MAVVNITTNLGQLKSINQKVTINYTTTLDSGELLYKYVVESELDWITVDEASITNTSTELTISANNSNLPRTGVVKFTAMTSNGSYQALYSISQQAFEIYPIWQDNYLTVSTLVNSIKYHITLDNEIIYSGRAYTTPNTNQVKIDISKICASYLNSSMENVIDNINNYNAIDGVKTFGVYINDELYSNFVYFNGYTYKATPTYYSTTNNSVLKLSEPIRKLYDNRQYLIYSFTGLGTSSFSNTFNVRTKLNNLNYINVPVTATLNPRTEYVFMYKPASTAVALLAFDETIPIKNTCAKYCLYYQNALGGWDSFLINGNDKQTDNITSYNYIKAVDNTTKGFGLKKYMNVINTDYKLYTDWLTDDEASRMYHLLESTEVYLHNLEDDTIVPVNIKNNTCEYKTYTNNGKRKFYYTIDCELAQTKIRH